MPKSGIPSPAQSQGAISSSRKHLASKSRRSRSVCSASGSNSTIRLSKMVAESFNLPSIPNKQFILIDETDVNIQTRRSSNSTGVSDRNDGVTVAPENRNNLNNLLDNLGLEIISPDNKNCSLELPESSDGESLCSVVISQHNLFSQRRIAPQNKFDQININRNDLTKLQESESDDDHNIDVAPKNLFNLASKPRSLPVFPEALLNISRNETVDKTKVISAPDQKEIRTLFGNSIPSKRKNMFTNFILSESEDETPEIEPRIFTFQKNNDNMDDRTPFRDLRLSTSLNDLEVDDWRHLPSSTMVENHSYESPPMKRARASKQSDGNKSQIYESIELCIGVEQYGRNGNKSNSKIDINKSTSFRETSCNESNQTNKINISKNRKSPNQTTKNETLVEQQFVNDDINIAQVEKEIQNPITKQDHTNDVGVTLETPRSKNKSKNSSSAKLQDSLEDLSKSRVTRNKSKSLRETSLSESNRTNKINKSENRKSPNQTTKNKTLVEQQFVNDDINIAQVEKEIQNPTTKQDPTNDEGLTLETPRSKNKSKNSSSAKLQNALEDLSKSRVTRNKSKSLCETLNEHNNSERNDKPKSRTNQTKTNNTVASERDENHEHDINNIIIDLQQNEKEIKNTEKVPVSKVLENKSNVSERQNQNVSKQTICDGEVKPPAEGENEKQKIQNDEQKYRMMNDDHELNKHLDCNKEEKMDVDVEEQDKCVLQYDEEIVTTEEEKEENALNNLEQNEIIDDKAISSHNEKKFKDGDQMDVDGQQSKCEVEHNEMKNYSQEQYNNEDKERNIKELQSKNISESQIREQSMSDERAQNDIEAEKQNNSTAEEQNVSDNEEQNNSEAEEQNASSAEEESASENEEQNNSVKECENESDQVDLDEQNQSELQNDKSNKSDSEQNESDKQSDNGVEDEIPQSTNEEPNISHDRSRRKNKERMTCPEMILHDKTNHIETTQIFPGRNTTGKSNTMYKNFNHRPSSVQSNRESTGFSNGSRDSSANNSGWDSHRTTRKTLRQTFGKDFTPRKSLRALVMEKSAKRQTNFNQEQRQTNTTYLEKTTNNKRNTNIETNDTIKTNNKTTNKNQTINKSTNQMPINNETSDGIQTSNTNDMLTNNATTNRPKTDNGTADQNQTNYVSIGEVQPTNETTDREKTNNESTGKMPTNNENTNRTETNNGTTDHNETNNVSTDKVQPTNETTDGEETNNESADEMETNKETSDEMETDNETFDKMQTNNVSTDEVQPTNETTDEEETNNESTDEMQTNNETSDEMDTDNETSDKMQTNNKSSDGMQTNIDTTDMRQTSIKQFADITDKRQFNLTEYGENTIRNTIPLANSTEYHNYESYREASLAQIDESDEESDHDASKQRRQATLEMYLQKVRKENMERKRKIDEEVKNSLKLPTFTFFKVPQKPVRPVKSLQNLNLKPKSKKPTIPSAMLPPEVIEDMKYKPPKRFKPSNASWITKRLYQFLETKLEPKYDYKARIRAEKLVETIYHFTKDIRRHHPIAPTHLVEALKLEMARLDIVKTHFQFYQFFHDYMPREVRVKVVPDIVNKIPPPKHGVFSDIIH